MVPMGQHMAPLRGARRLVEADGVLPYIAPGAVYDGDDIGTWRWRQQEPGTWAQILPE